MPKPLDGVRAVILEHRYPAQLTQLLERQGALVQSCPLLEETPLEDTEAAQQFIALCESGAADYVVFFTGVGVDFLLRAVPRPEALARPIVLARGPKAVNALRRAGARIDLVADAPTTEGIVQTLSRENLQGKSVLVQLYGQENPALTGALEARGARVTAISLYRYSAASGREDVARLLETLVAGKVDAIVFTSGPQLQFLLKFAHERNCEDALRERFRKDVAVVAIGEVTARAIAAAGFEAAVVPADPKMGPMVTAMAAYFEKRRAQ